MTNKPYQSFDYFIAGLILGLATGLLLLMF